ncbi:hypothetical protein KPH14_001461 [Odynerus spinipes]|uniref:Uncharacterized protein n=1 Tax=Odynerus spinipes TaxID=1348599 RepID=A0AAD9RUI0_9HYME|nr:hypothetical protein KPH14_001461 [Odynerus spinipes]
MAYVSLEFGKGFNDPRVLARMYAQERHAKRNPGTVLGGIPLWGYAKSRQHCCRRRRWWWRRRCGGGTSTGVERQGGRVLDGERGRGGMTSEGGLPATLVGVSKFQASNLLRPVRH